MTEYQQYIKDNIKIDENGCWIWQGKLSAKGYGRAKRLNNCQWAHRNSYTVFNGHINKHVVMHKCDMPSCVNPEHLVDAYHHENIKDCVIKGRHKPNRGGPTPKFSEETILEVQNVYENNGYTFREIAAGFNISERHVRRMILEKVKGYKNV